jgi:uncharacterized OB-fold protein
MSTYWEKMGDSFALPFCVKCAQFHFYPKPACPHCGSTDVSQSEVSGYGEVYSFSIVYRSPSPAFNDEVPYVIAIVATREGPHLMTRLVDVPFNLLAIGLRVQLVPRSKRLSAEPVFTIELAKQEYSDSTT